jgi:hypothetical protein
MPLIRGSLRGDCRYDCSRKAQEKLAQKAGGKIFSGKKLVDVPDLLHNKQPDIAT